MGTSPRKSMGKSGAGAVTHQKLCGETNPRVVQLVSIVAMWLLMESRSAREQARSSVPGATCFVRMGAKRNPPVE